MVLALRVGVLYLSLWAGAYMVDKALNDQNAPPIIVDVRLCFGCGIFHPRSGGQLEK